ncbi:cryptochrome/photolyase family protein [Teichococcus vastitatis]|uniref:cryptochrome/photolyase family protein n=1 Tax=Teichococcus vastitatis TaxID=2307076 RepID=UPI000E75D7F7|nr:deoxyribodipyrimidine photo-lyase [Pseudoroseomonas vastitatis]
MSDAPTLLWLRQDLRLADHPALLAAAAEGPLLPVFVLDGAAAGRWAPGGAARWWLHHSLEALAADLAGRGAPLLLLRGDAARLVPALAWETGASAVHATLMCEPWARRQDAAVAAALAADGRRLSLHAGNLLLHPDAVRSGQNKPYGLYAPFARAVRAQVPPMEPIPAPPRLQAAACPRGGVALADLGLLPPAREGDWAAAFPEMLTPGEAGARERLHRFRRGVADYRAGRDSPAGDGTSRLSPHLRWGELSPRQVWHAAAEQDGHEAFLREILWREFSHHLLWHRPELPDTALRPAYARFPYRPDAMRLRAWQRGLTGYPIVDAGMRQLWRHGWMHNRVRMVAGSLLVKQLLQPWQEGAAWFWDTLVDADLGNNSTNWQWVAGSGLDAAPYFRIFNPVLQGRKFDPEGRYVRHFLPQLARLPDRWLHEPWAAPAAVLRQAGLRLGHDYPHPIVEPAQGRADALAALGELRAAA